MKLKAVLFAILSMLVMISDTLYAGVEQALGPLKWRHRVIILMADSPSSSELKQQLDILSTAKQGVDDRDLVIINVPKGSEFKRVSSDEFQEIYNSSQSKFKFILLGKDGAVKLHATEPITADRIFSTIDAMPMRRMEMLLE